MVRPANYVTPVLTALAGSNADLFPTILEVYVPDGSIVLDATYGTGVFWRKVDETKYHLTKNDLDPSRGDTHDDFRHMPQKECTFDAVVLDPPYLYVGGFKTLKDSIDRGYQNAARALGGIVGADAVNQMYADGMMEAWRILKPGGVLIVKCMDQVESSRLRSAIAILVPIAKLMLFELLDIFVLVQRGKPCMRHPYQMHARRNHSYFLVLKKKTSGRKK